MIEDIICPDCFGDGVETCHNPDHGFLSGVVNATYGADESACPCCGHNIDHKMKGKCYTCNATGKVSEEDYQDYVDEYVPEEDQEEIYKYCFKNINKNDRNII